MQSSNHSPGNTSGTAAVRQPVQTDSTPASEQVTTDARASRVAELREQYEQGTYQVDAARLASDIIAQHLKR